MILIDKCKFFFFCRYWVYEFESKMRFIGDDKDIVFLKVYLSLG